MLHFSITHFSDAINFLQMAYESLALISTALSRLDSGQLGVCRYTVKGYHNKAAELLVVHSLYFVSGLENQWRYCILWVNPSLPVAVVLF